MIFYTGAAAAAVMTGVLLLDRGYGIGTMLRSAQGVRGKDLSCNWAAQDMARDYFLRCYAFPKWASILVLLLTLISTVCFLFTLFTWNPKSLFVIIEEMSLIVMSIIALLPLRKSRKVYLKGLLYSYGNNRQNLLNMIKESKVQQPSLFIDWVTLKPSWIALSILGTALMGGALLNFPGMMNALHLPITLSMWILEAANLFSIPIFLGYGLLGVFPWPSATVPDNVYYPLLVLKRAIEKGNI
ncbi:hypothetical protein [Acidithiobacillus concretivorus]|uniref:Uncharacterized protein n=1 Tax=Acidithiobacillus concretivorus TaxID=3063952 RepID=A0ABS5ZSE4_9PROT|nr:hypothetical protein [Acidithiobacillus concretivorus]MBU2739599.1 hypothetical protein [Acidithiobacillus concretivorus]